MSARDVLDQIRQRAENATTGPWLQDGAHVVHPPWEADDDTYWVADTFEESATTEFIAASRSDVPRLVAALTAVLDLHRADSDGDCIACGVDTWEEAIPWPCETVRAITDALTPKENDS